MPFKATQAELIKLSDRHASELRSHTQAACESANAIYRSAGEQEGAGRFTALRKGLTSLVASTRDSARTLAVAHVLGELRAAIGSKADRVSLHVPAAANPADVSEYISNAITAAREAEDIASTSYRAHTILETEATNAYKAGRDVALHSLRSIPDSQAIKLGFKVARSESEFRDIDEAELVTRADDGEWIPLIGARWNSRGDACEKCRGVDGELRPLGIGFSLGGPSAHARCQCVTSLWVLPIWIPGEKSLGGKGKDAVEHNHTANAGLCWFGASIAESREIDEASRTIRGAIASDESEDSHGSVIKADGWDLKRHQRNPVLLWGHDSYEPENILGTASMRVEGKKLVADLTFLPEGVNPKADLVFKQIKARVLRGLSVGFRAVKYHFESNKESEDLLVFDEQELVELSVVAVPSNANTLIKQVRAMGMGMPDLPTTSEAIPAATSPAFAKENHMSDNAKTVVALPPEIAARLGAESVEQAIGELAKRELQLDQITKERDALKSQVEVFKVEAEKRDQADAEAEVDALIKAGRISKDQRDNALNLFKANRQAFRGMYPAVAEAPMEHLFRQVTKSEPAPQPAKDGPPKAGNPVLAMARKLMSEGVDRDLAFNQAHVHFSKVGPTR